MQATEPVVWGGGGRYNRTVTTDMHLRPCCLVSVGYLHVILYDKKFFNHCDMDSAYVHVSVISSFISQGMSICNYVYVLITVIL